MLYISIFTIVCLQTNTSVYFCNKHLFAIKIFKCKIYCLLLFSILFTFMKDRIKQIMDVEQLTPSAFADKLQLGRAVISHILNGRNNPSLDVVTRILTKIDYINPDWLITGHGDMYKNAPDTISSPGNGQSHQRPESDIHKVPDLFSQNYVNPPIPPKESEYRKENIVEQPYNTTESIVNKEIIYQKLPDKKISRIIIYYSDNTFEVFNADNKPL